MITFINVVETGKCEVIIDKCVIIDCEYLKTSDGRILVKHDCAIGSRFDVIIDKGSSIIEYSGINYEG